MNKNKSKNKNKNRPKKDFGSPTRFSVINAQSIYSNGKQTPGKTMKIIDVTIAGQSMTSGGLVTTLFPVSQGVGINQRTGDTAILGNMWINYTAVGINVDIFTTGRIIIFQWIPNSLIGSPGVTNILQTASELSMYNFQFSNQFHVVLDHMIYFTGITASPQNGLMGWSGKVSLKNCFKKVEWNPGLATGSNQFYILTISNSTVAPFPIFDSVSRVSFDDNI